mmetsp:Transcript_7826/g.18447  ORF Transcript_7826/g.18447 Transcript_7826/m.18447 type:complete len:419 (+) Transcript_7826:391-1647(+)
MSNTETPRTGPPQAGAASVLELLEGLDDCGEGLRATLRVLVPALANERAHVGGDAGGERGPDVVLEHAPGDEHLVQPSVGVRAGAVEDLPEEDAVAEDVAALVVGRAARRLEVGEHLWRHPLHGPARFAPHLLLEGHAEVSDAGGEAAGHEDVEGLEVAVHEAQVVDVLEPERALLGDAPRRRRVELHLLLRVQVEQRALLADLRQQQRAPVRVHFDLRAHQVVAVGVVQLLQQRHLVHEVFEDLLRRLPEHLLARHLLALVGPEVDRALPALAELLDLDELAVDHRAYSGRALGVAVRPLLVRDHVILRVALRLLRGVAVLVELGRGAQDPVDQLQETHDVDNLLARGRAGLVADLLERVVQGVWHVLEVLLEEVLHVLEIQSPRLLAVSLLVVGAELEEGLHHVTFLLRVGHEVRV